MSTPSASDSTTTPKPVRPSIMICGAGLGGLTLGALLERTGIHYQIFERSYEINPVGSAISLSTSVMPMFEQLGMLEELTSISMKGGVTKMYSEEQKLLGSMDWASNMEERFHYPRLLMSRPKLYEVLLAQIPKEKIHFGKKLLSHEETETGILLKFSDNSSIEASILVGADGANSAVRQNLYKQLEKKELLPPSDKLPLKYSSISLVGQTKVLDPNQFEILKGRVCHPEVVLSQGKPLVSTAFPTAQNTICWMVIEFLDKESSKIHDNFRTSEWGSEAAAVMAKDEYIRGVKIPGATNATIGELIDLTPKELMSKVMLEEKCFKTWTSGRTVLMGDACHKMSPSVGQGAVNAMLDALVLANYIEALRSSKVPELRTAFQAYQKERYDIAKAAVDGSAAMMMILTKGIVGVILRKIMLDPPKWLWNSVVKKTEAYRPQVAFLPPVQDTGSVKTPYQPSLNLPTSTRRTAAAPVVAAV